MIPPVDSLENMRLDLSVRDLLEIAAPGLGAPIVVLGLAPGARTVSVVAAVGPSDDLLAALGTSGPPGETTVLDEALQSGEPIVVNPSTDPRWPKRWRPLDPLNAGDVLVFPIRHGQEPRGVLLVLGWSRVSSDAALRLVSTVARKAGSESGGSRPERTAESAALDALLEAAADGIILIDERGIIEGFNAAASRIFGHAAAEIIGRNVSALMPEPDASHHDGYLESYRRTGVAKIIGKGREVTARRKDGTLFPVELAIGEVDDPSGRRRFVGLLRDITERRAMVDRLREQEEQLRLTFERAPQGMLTADLHGRVTRVNQALSDALHVPDEGLLGRPIFSLFEVEDATAPERWNEFVVGALRSLEFAAAFRRKDGEMLRAMAYCGLVHDPDGGPRWVVVHLEDQTERLRAEAEATQHREELAHVARVSTMGEMATAIAHEVNQPLTAISVFAQATRRMMELDKLDRTELADTLDQIGHEAQRAGAIIHRLRNLVRKRESKRVASDLNGLIRDAMQLAEFDARQRNIAIRLELTEGLPIVYVDTIQVQQVVLNLVRNAIEATPTGHPSHVLVRTERGDPGQVRISVGDEGVGVSAEAAEGLFRQFFTTKSTGMGLGLSISKTIVEAHGGKMGFSANTRVGTTFYFTLPIRGGMRDDLD